MARLGRTIRQRPIIVRNESLALANHGGGQADETVVSTGNSAAGGAAWDVVTIGADATLVYDVVAGNTWYRLASGATSAAARADWTTASLGAGGWGRYFGRLYFRIPAASLGTTTIGLFRGRSGSNQSSRITVSTGNKVQLRNAGNSAAATGAVDIAADTSYRIEWDVVVGATAAGSVRLYAGDSTTALETISTASADFGTGLVDEFGFGLFTAASNHPAYWMRGFQVNNAGLPGPLGDLPVVGSSAGADSITAADTLTRGALTRARAVGETLAAADGVSATTVRARTFADSITLADTVTRLVARPRPSADTVGLADAATRGTFVRSRTFADSITLADTVARLVAMLRAGGESAALADQVVRAAMARPRSLSDAVTLADTVARLAARQRTAGDAVELADGADSFSSTLSFGADALNLADAVARAALVRSRTIADAVAFADAVAGASGSSRGIDDAISLADAVTRGPWSRPRSGADAAALADAVARGVFGRTRTIADTIALVDSAGGGEGPPLVAAAHSIADTTPPATIRRTA